jgi:hypothetical protein
MAPVVVGDTGETDAVTEVATEDGGRATGAGIEFD